MLKRFNFFDKDVVAHSTSSRFYFPNTTCICGDTPLARLRDGQDTNHDPSREPVGSRLLVGDTLGNVMVVQRDLSCSYFNNGNNIQIRHMKQTSMGLIVVVGTRTTPTGKVDVMINLWALNRWNEETGDFVSSRIEEHENLAIQEDLYGMSTRKAPVKSLRTLSLAQSYVKEKEKPPWDIEVWPDVTCIDILDDVSQICLGLKNGFAVLIRGDIFNERSALDFAILPPPSYVPKSQDLVGSNDARRVTLHRLAQVAFEQGSFPLISGVGFSVRDDIESPSGKPVQTVHLWVASGIGGGLRSFTTTSNASPSASRSRNVPMAWPLGERIAAVKLGPLLDSEGCELNCSCVGVPGSSRENQQLSVHTNSNTGTMNDSDNGGTRKQRPTVPSFVAAISTLSSAMERRRQQSGVDGVNHSATSSATKRQDVHQAPSSVFIMGKSDRVAYFTPEDPGSCYAVGGHKVFLEWFRDYLVIVSDGSTLNHQNKEATEDNRLSERRDVINLYDFKNKFIALNFPLRGKDDAGYTKFIVSVWDRILIFTSTQRVYQLVEKDTRTKLNDLFKRNLYSTAISLAQASGCSYTMITDIHRMYGDHLYTKGNFDDAVVQYTKTIGHVEPSYVIRRFLDSQRIGNLTTYLEALHMDFPHIVKPTGDHTTLLLNCYTKQMKESKLQAFVRNDRITQSIDIKAAIGVLQSAGYYDQALYLAKRYGEHDLYLTTQLEKRPDYQYEDALDYIKRLDLRDAETHLNDYGKHLMSKLPKQTTQAIKSLCTNSWKDGVATTKESMLKRNQHSNTNGTSENDQPLQNTGAGFSCNPESFIHIFVDHPLELEDFLKSIVKYDEASASQLVWNTLLELLLTSLSSNLNNQEDKTESDSSPSRSNMELEQEVMQILTNPSAKYDPHHALVLVQAHGFKQGQLFLYERLQMYHMLIRHYMETRDNFAIISKCKAYGAKDPNLWVQVLMHFARRQDDCQQEIRQVLHHIERLRILPPLLVVQILSTNPNLPLSTVRPYIVGQLERSQTLIEEDEREIEQLQADTERMRNDIHQLETQPKVFTSTKCNLTGAPLELPTIHFLSGNSYNLSSLPGGGGAQSPTGDPSRLEKLEDPKCVAEQQSVGDIIHGLRKLNAEGVDEEFFHQLELSRDGFETISEYFGKCIFDKTQLSSSDSNESNKKNPFI